MKQALIYSLKVWLTSVILSPVLTLTILFTNIFSSSYAVNVRFSPIELAAYFLLLIVVSTSVNRSRLNERLKKLILLLVGELCVGGVFYYLNGRNMFRELSHTLPLICYASVVGASIWAYELKSA
jgi:hypothetical protein